MVVLSEQIEIEPSLLKPVRSLSAESLANAGIELYNMRREEGLYRVVVRRYLRDDDPKWNEEIRFQRELRNPGHIILPPIIAFGRVREYPATIEEPTSIANLRSIIETKRKVSGTGLPLQAVVHLLLRVLEGLEYLHEREVVSRSIHPDRLGVVIKSAQPRFVVLDNIRREGGPALTMLAKDTQSIRIHQDSFCPPESTDEIITLQWDIWSIGALAYYLLTGVEILPTLRLGKNIVVYDAKDINKHIPERLKELKTILARQVKKSVVDEFAEVLSECLNPDYTSRPPLLSIREVLVDIDSRQGLPYSAATLLIRGLINSRSLTPREMLLLERMLNEPSRFVVLKGNASSPEPEPKTVSTPVKTSSPQAKTEEKEPPVRFGPLGRWLYRTLVKRDEDEKGR